MKLHIVWSGDYYHEGYSGHLELNDGSCYGLCCLEHQVINVLLKVLPDAELVIMNAQTKEMWEAGE